MLLSGAASILSSYFMQLHNHKLYRLTSAALLILLTASARTRIVRIYLRMFTLLRCILCRIILVCSGNLGNLLSLNLLFNLNMIQKTDGIFLNRRNHIVEHIETCHLVLYQRISLSICLKSDTLTHQYDPSTYDR